MNGKFKKIIGFILTLAFLAVISANLSMVAAAKAEAADDAECKAAIADYWTAVNDGDWVAWVASFAPSANDYAEELVSRPENYSNNIGILTVTGAEIVSATLIDDENAMQEAYKQLEDFFKSERTYACYRVEVRLTVNEENGYFSNGVNSFIMTLIKENGAWGVGAMSADTEPEEADMVIINLERLTPAPKSAYGFGNVPGCKAVPSTVNVRDEKNVVHKNVPFDTYLTNVIFHEISDDYHEQATCAHIVQIKTYTWCFCVKKPYAAYGFDICSGYVSFKSRQPASGETQNITRCINTVKDYYMASSTGTGSKLFYADFTGKPIPADGGQGGGEFFQKQAQVLASQQNYSWRQILEYFYDYSYVDGENNTYVGKVQFLTQGSHTVSSAYSTTTTHHWKTCTKCGTVMSSSYHTHTWVLSYGQYRCSTCGEPKVTSADSFPTDPVEKKQECRKLELVFHAVKPNAQITLCADDRQRHD